MEAKDLHAKPTKSLMDEIAEDPAIINRSAPEPAVEVTAPVIADASVATATEAAGVAQQDQMNRGMKAPEFDLLHPNSLDDEPQSTVVLAANGAVAGPPPPVKKHKKLALIIGAVLVVLVAGGGAAYALYGHPAQPVAVAPAQSTPSPSPTIAPTPTPTPTPLPTPAATPVPAEVTAPAAAPTVDRPQAVKVTVKSGLWLRSTPDSSNQKNVIGWMPNGATVSVDSVGSFWWHGTFNGRAGYFAVNYTK